MSDQLLPGDLVSIGGCMIDVIKPLPPFSHHPTTSTYSTPVIAFLIYIYLKSEEFNDYC